MVPAQARVDVLVILETSRLGLDAGADDLCAAGPGLARVDKGLGLAQTGSEPVLEPVQPGLAPRQADPSPGGSGPVRLRSCDAVASPAALSWPDAGSPVPVSLAATVPLLKSPRRRSTLCPLGHTQARDQSIPGAKMERTMTTTPPLPAAAIALALGLAASAAAAQSPQEAWSQGFVGRYAIEGQCNDPDNVWVLGAQSIQTYRFECEGISDMSEDGGGTLKVSFNDCRFRGERIPDRILHFQDVGQNLVSAIDTSNGAQAILRPCDG
jgi:hypothetical protein